MNWHISRREHLGSSLSAQGADQFPGRSEVGAKFVVADTVEVDSHPALDSYIRWSVVDGREVGDESLLLSWWGGYPNPDMSVVVMVVSEHRKDPFLDKKRRLSMGDLLGRARQGQANSADSLYPRITVHVR